MKFKKLLIVLFLLMPFSAKAMTFVYEGHGKYRHSFDLRLQYSLQNNEYQALFSRQSIKTMPTLVEDQGFYYSTGTIKNKKFATELSSFKKVTSRGEEFFTIDMADEQNIYDYITAFLDFVIGLEPQDKKYHIVDTKRDISVDIKYKGTVAPNEIESIVPATEIYEYDAYINVNKGPAKGWNFDSLNRNKEPNLKLYVAKVSNIKELVLIKAVWSSGYKKETILNLTKILDDNDGVLYTKPEQNQAKEPNFFARLFANIF